MSSHDCLSESPIVTTEQSLYVISAIAIIYIILTAVLLIVLFGFWLVIILSCQNLKHIIVNTLNSDNLAVTNAI
jgi:hypothetical protein